MQAEEGKLEELNAELKQDMESITANYDVANEKLETVELKPTKTNITVKLVALAWLPYLRDAVGVLTPAF